MSDLGNKGIMAKNIRRYMNTFNVTQTEICNTLGIKMPTFSDWVNAKTYPRIDKIELMANYFGISKADLVEDNTKKVTLHEYPTDPDIRRIQRAREKMSEQEKNKMMRILEISFDDYFGDDFIDEDND